MVGDIADLLRAFAESDDVAAVCEALAAGVTNASHATFSVAAARDFESDFVEVFGDRAAPWRFIARLQGAFNRSLAGGDPGLRALLEGGRADLSVTSEDGASSGEFARLARDFGISGVVAWPIGDAAACAGAVVSCNTRAGAGANGRSHVVTELVAHAELALSRARRFEALRAESERNQALIAESAEGICTLDHELRVGLWNNAAERITGIPRSAIAGKTLTEAGLHPEAPAFPKAFASFSDASEIFVGDPGRAIDVSLAKPNGENVWISLAGALVGSAARRPGLACCFRDITPQKKLESLRRDFVSLVTHQLRTPLTAIRGYAELLGAIEMPPDRVREFGDVIAGASTRLADAITDVMDFERLTPSRDGLHLTKVSLHEALNLGLAAVKMPRSHRVTFPEGLASITLEADLDRLSRLFAHIFGNAVRYWPAGGVIDVEAAQDGDFVRCAIVDHGPGIDNAEHAELFSPYHRTAKSHPGARQGMGLGLSLAKRIAEAHGGRIALSETGGGGATVTVWLPGG